MSRVTVGFDGSPAARAALDWGRGEADLRAVPLDVVVVEPHEHSESSAGSALSAAADMARRAGIGTTARVVLRSGDPAEELLRDTGNSDVVAVGTRGRGAVVGLALGSVSRACLQRAICPVAVLTDGSTWTQTPRRRVIVGIDGSEQSRDALHLAACEARLRGAALHALHVVNWDPIGVELIVPTTRQLVGWGKDLVAQELAASGVRARPVIVRGHPTQVLVRHSAHADLLVLGRRGRGGLATAVLGSTSDYCVRHSHCPVLIAPTAP